MEDGGRSFVPRSCKIEEPSSHFRRISPSSKKSRNRCRLSSYFRLFFETENRRRRGFTMFSVEYRRFKIIIICSSTPKIEDRGKFVSSEPQDRRWKIFKKNELFEDGVFFEETTHLRRIHHLRRNPFFLRALPFHLRSPSLEYRRTLSSMFRTICRVQNPDLPRTGRVDAHGRAAKRGQAGTPTEQFDPKASKTRLLNDSSEARTSEILCKPMEEHNDRLTSGE